jgi:hypothetical protein
MTLEPNCSNCAFFLGNKDIHSEQGICRRNPPSVFPVPSMNRIAGQPARLDWISNFPPVNSNSWCGGYYPAQNIEPDAALKPLEN